MEQTPETEIVFVVEASDGALAEEMAALFDEGDVSTSDNFVGGTEIAVFLTAAKDVLAKVLGFVGKNRDRIKSAKLTIGRESVSLEGYSAGEVEQLLGSSGFRRAMDTVHKQRS